MRTAAAQQAATITATATVTASYAAYHVQPALSAARLAAGERDARGLRIPELGVLQVEGAAGAQVRLESPAATRSAVPARVVRASIAFVAN